MGTSAGRLDFFRKKLKPVQLLSVLPQSFSLPPTPRNNKNFRKLQKNDPPVLLRLGGLVEVQYGRGEECGQSPGGRHQAPGPPPGPAKVHRVADGVVAVDAEGHQDVGGGVRHQGLGEADHPGRKNMHESWEMKLGAIFFKKIIKKIAGWSHKGVI